MSLRDEPVQHFPQEGIMVSSNDSDIGGRRGVFRTAAAMTAAVALAAVAAPRPAAAQQRRIADEDILNFALNLEYLEAEYYSRAVTGAGLGASDMGAGMGTGAGMIAGGRRVRFQTPALQSFAESVMTDELEHVRFLRSALGNKAVPEPAIDLKAGFAAAARAAGLPASFDPFADETSFFLGAFLFEDVGATAYKGAAPLISNKDTLTAAAAIHAVEAYHAGMIRSVLYRRGPQAINAANAISMARGQLSQAPNLDQGISMNGQANIIPADADGIGFGRTPQQVLSIVYGSNQPGTTGGAFFPQGVNGALRST